MESIEKLRERSHLDDNRWTLSDGRVMWYTNGEPNDPNAVNWGEQMREIADEIEREIAERYMELSVDADGVPIRLGDVMDGVGLYDTPSDVTGEVIEVSFNSTDDNDCVASVALQVWSDDGKSWRRVYIDQYASRYRHHVKPRTLEDVLREYRHDASVIYDDPNIGGEDRADALEGLDEKVAAEIRELMGVDA